MNSIWFKAWGEKVVPHFVKILSISGTAKRTLVSRLEKYKRPCHYWLSSATRSRYLQNSWEVCWLYGSHGRQMCRIDCAFYKLKLSASGFLRMVRHKNFWGSKRHIFVCVHTKRRLLFVYPSADCNVSYQIEEISTKYSLAMSFLGIYKKRFKWRWV